MRLRNKEIPPPSKLKDPPPASLDPVPSNDKHAPFANDPFRGPPLLAPPEDIEALKGPNFLTTALIDYLIREAMPHDLPDHVLIGSSNSMSYFETMNRKKVDSTISVDSESAKILRRKYQYYSLRPYRFISVNCTKGHFFVVSVIFDMSSPAAFLDVSVYDSLRKSGRNDAVLKTTVPGKFLMNLQLFLGQFVAFGTKVYDRLLSEPELILQSAKHLPSPQQQNSHDCGVFALATLLHLIDEVTKSLDGSFTQQNITKLRQGLYMQLSKGGSLDWDFFCSYLPKLKRRSNQESVARRNELNDERNNDGLSSSEDEYVPYQGSDESDVEATPLPTLPPPLLTIDKDLTDPVERNALQVVDSTFKEMFIDRPKKYNNLQELTIDIDQYELMSGYRLIIKKSEEYSRIYVCGSHIGCCFRAKFGKIRLEDGIILKDAVTTPLHSGERAPPSAKGRAHKKRLKGRIEPTVNEVASIKDGKPKAKDVMKAAAHLKGIDATYHQAYRAIKRATLENWEQHESSFQLIVPYLLKFKELNPDSTVAYERDMQHLNRIFVCPGIMKSSMRYVRPVMSLDAAHMKSEWKGVLYVASVKTACDEIYPVAIGITRDNENEEGWTWFLGLLHSAIEILVMDHPHPRVAFKYFSFVSDRQKGLIQSLKTVFPQNHSWFCAIHIARNVERFAGKSVSKYVHPLSVSCSNRLSNDWMGKIGQLSKKARKYLEEIPQNQWRGTAWLENLCLPPRYGIVTSNMSESVNNMFEKARDGSWLYSIDTMLGTMTDRIATLREGVEQEEGVVAKISKIVKDNWEMCAGYKVVEVHKTGDEFSIVRRTTTASESPRRYNIDIVLCTCTCGKWQEFGYPCVDAMAYFRLHEKLSLTRILEEKVDVQYKYETEKKLLEFNVVPVCVETIAADGYTLPPIPLTKRTSGRPKKQRFRKRSKWANEPENSNIRCSECGAPGHNKRTCETRKRMMEEREREDKKKSPDERMNELDLS